MKASRQPLGTRERGFVLIGVVMFVLALTILGLSLFSLSSYEGQFVQRSLRESEALYAAQSALERAKFVLGKRRDLNAVHDIVDPPSTYYACAWQNGDSTRVFKLDEVVRIRVGASVGGERRMVEAQFTPREADSYYKRLITTTEDVEILDEATYCEQTSLNGVIWQGDNDMPDWVSCSPYSDVRITPVVNLTPPDVRGFFDQYWDSAVPISRSPTTSNVEFPLDWRNPSFVRTGGDDPDNPGFSCYLGDSSTINISNRGTVIWLLEHGFLAARQVRVVGTPNDCLVIVSRENKMPEPQQESSDEGRIGIWFRGGLQSDVVPVILVADREVRIRHSNETETDHSSRVSYLSIFTKHVTVSGPLAPHMMRLYHDPESPYDQPDGLIDQLCDIGALPNSSSLGLTFERRAGTWKEIRDLDNPPAVTN